MSLPLHTRMLQASGETQDGPFIVLIIICILFCFIWAPLICQRRMRMRQRQRAEAQASEMIRSSIEQFRQQWVAASGAAAAATSAGGRLSIEDRRDYIRNVVVSKCVTEVTPMDTGGLKSESDEELGSEKEAKSMDGLEPTEPINLVIADLSNPSDTSKLTAVEPCAICLNEYCVGDVLCWSQTERCKHFFHRPCIEGWLLREEQSGRNRSACPCCRHNFLSLGDESSDADDETGGEDIFQNAQNNRFAVMSTNNEDFQLMRGMRLFYMLSQIQQNQANGIANGNDGGNTGDSAVELSSMARMRQLIHAEMENETQDDSPTDEEDDNDGQNDVEEGMNDAPIHIGTDSDSDDPAPMTPMNDTPSIDGSPESGIHDESTEQQHTSSPSTNT